MKPIALMLAMLLVPLGAAQALSPEMNTLYVHTDLTMQTSPPSGGTTSGGALTEPRTWTITMAPPLAESASLDLAGTVDFTITMGGSVHVGEVDVYVELHNGATLVAQTDVKSHALRTGYTALTWSVTPLVDTVDPAAGNLVMTIHADGVASSYFLDTDASHVALPIVLPPATGPETVNVTIDDARLARELSFNSTTNRTETITWSQGVGDVDMRLAANVTAGHVNITIRDAGNATVFNRSIDAPAAFTEELRGGQNGTWNITLEFVAFVGQISLVLEPAPPMNVTAPEPAPNNETAPPPEEEDSPVPLVLAVIALVVMARRRR